MSSEHPTRTTQQEHDHHRWADDGGRTPEPEVTKPRIPARSPWRAIGIAAAVGFAIGWLTAPESHGGR